jgi:hypothetical protein
VQVSPVDIQAWASDTGSEYPATAAEKAAVLPAVAAWKAEQLADAKASRGDNAISPLAAGIGAAGLGLAGLVAFNHFRKQGLSEPEAAAMAKQAENAAVAAAPAPAAAPELAALRVANPADQAIRNRAPARSGATYDGPRLRSDAPAAATLETRGGRNVGSALARQQGQYKARTSEGFHDPALASLDTPAKRDAYLAGVADANGTDSPQFRQAQSLIAAMETSTETGVAPTSFLARNDATTGNPKPFTGKERYGSTTAEEEASDGGFLAQSRTKSNTSAQAEYQSRESAPQSSSKPANASVFFLDSDGSYKSYRGNTTLLDKDGRPQQDKRGNILYTGRRADGSPIAESDLAYFPTDDPEFYARSGLAHPALKAADIAANAGELPDRRYASDEDQSIKGMLESLGPSDPRFSDGIRKDGVSDNWTVGTNGAGERVPLDVSGFQSELGSSGPMAGARLRAALSDYRKNTGTPVPTNVAVAWAADLARQHGVDASTVLRGATAAGPSARLVAPQPERSSRVSAHALGGGNSADQLDRIYTSLGMHAGADAWELEGMVRSGDIKGAAAALASQLPALTAVNGGGLRGMGQDEKLSLVAEGVAAGLNDLSTVLSKYPEAASKFGIGKGPGGFGIDAYLKSYVRDWVTVRGLQLDPTGQPTYQVPNDAFEILAHRAHQSGRNTLHELNDIVRGSSNGLLGALKIDRLVSSAQSTKQGDPNTNATSFAQTVFDMTDRDLVSTRLLDEAAGDVNLSFGTRRTSDVTAGLYNRNPSEADVDQRIADYRTLADGTVTPYPVNATLAAQVSGADYSTPEGQARQQQAKDAQAWISANADQLERQRADFNRGLFDGKSAGRGFAISADQRGAFLTGNTQGMNTSYREELVNDEDATPVDVAQDNIREARLNNQIPEPEGVEVETRSTAVPLSEADATARQYGSQKLYFKNLGPGSKGAMPAGEAFYPRQALRRYLQERGQDQAVGRILDSYMGSSWQPETGVGFEVGAREPVRGMGPQPAPPAAPVTFAVPPERTPVRTGPPLDLPNGAVDPYRTVQVQRTGIGRRVPLHIPGYADQPPQLQLDWQVNTSDRAPGNLYGQLSDAPRGGITITGSTETAARHRAALEARIGGGGPGRLLAIDQAAQARRNQVDADRIARGIPTGGGVMLGETFVEPSATHAGQSFRDDENLRDQIAVSTGSIAAGRRANAQTSAAALELAQRPGGYSGGELEPAQRPQILQLDHGTASGLGRSGSTFEQKPIAAAPISSVPQAAQDQLNTLRSSLERPVTAAYSTQELDDARARHIMSYIQSAATPSFDKAGRQTSGWTGGDSHHGGARLAGRVDRNVGAYNAPSEAMLGALALAARRRTGAS